MYHTQYQAQVYITSMLEFDDDAHASTWMNSDGAEHAPEETLAEQDQYIGSESDVDIDLPLWIYSFNEGNARLQSWGHKCCVMC
eukprot:4881076-Amphidinium_carterae.2